MFDTLSLMQAARAQGPTLTVYVQASPRGHCSPCAPHIQAASAAGLEMQGRGGYLMLGAGSGGQLHATCQLKALPDRHTATGSY